jgi:hypothetical protein
LTERPSLRAEQHGLDRRDIVVEDAAMCWM